MIKFKYFLFSILSVIILVSCSRSETQILEDVSGVWKIADENALFIFDLSSNEKTVKVQDKIIPVKIKNIDKENSIISLEIEDNNGDLIVWTIQQLWNENEDAFTLLLTVQTGAQSELTFIRNI